jgi:hypothetical protein
MPTLYIRGGNGTLGLSLSQLLLLIISLSYIYRERVEGCQARVPVAPLMTKSARVPRVGMALLMTMLALLRLFFVPGPCFLRTRSSEPSVATEVETECR